MTHSPRRGTGTRGASGALDRLVSATPDKRDRVVDAARALSIVIVTLWHWTLSITHRNADGDLVMPNPIDAVPGGWLATWVLQIMPVFFLVGGYANLAGWERHRANEESAGRFVADRLRRLSVPTAAWAAIWLAGELITAALPGPHHWMWQWFPGYLTPLWFLVMYSLLILAVPVTATLHARHAAGVLATLAGLIVLGSVLGRGVGLTWAEWVTAALVWLLCHQLGYAWRTWRLGRRPLGPRLVVTGTGLLALAVLTMFARYPHSMVGTVGDTESNIFPTNATIAALAVFQLGLLALITPAATHLLRRRGVWKPVVALNVVAITVFLWHMTAYLVALWVYERLGHTLPSKPTADWWAQRWYWLLAPLAALLALIAVFAPVEIRTRGSSRKPNPGGER
ncbi:acyltransferase family protein [Streptomyces sp. Inha503]|uniref:acyltransferase family protein n=1 Tax=Streptomyces sp. Inha503 TaxID=3383314 RepID=UPI0039A39456